MRIKDQRHSIDRMPVWIIFVFSLIFTSCQINELDVFTQESQPHDTVEGVKEFATEIKPTQSILTTTLAQPTITPLLTETKVNTPTPTATETRILTLSNPRLVKKAVELPITGVLMAVSIDGKFVASVNNDVSRISVYDLNNSEIKWQLDLDSYPLRTTTLAVSSDGNFLATGGVNENVFVWDTVTGELLHSLSVPYYTVDKVAFSLENDVLAVSATETHSSDARLMLWDVSTGQMIDTFPSQNVPEINIPNSASNGKDRIYGWNVGDTIFIPNQTHLLAMTIDYHTSQEIDTTSALYYWDIKNQRLEPSWEGTWGRTLTVSSDGHLLAAEINEQVYVIDIQTGQELFKLLPNNNGFRRLALTNMGILAQLDRDGNVTIWNSEGELLAILNNKDTISDIAFTSDGNLLVAFYSSNNDVPIEIWEIEDR